MHYGITYMHCHTHSMYIYSNQDTLYIVCHAAKDAGASHLSLIRPIVDIVIKITDLCQ